MGAAEGGVAASENEEGSAHPPQDDARAANGARGPGHRHTQGRRRQPRTATGVNVGSLSALPHHAQDITTIKSEGPPARGVHRAGRPGRHGSRVPGGGGRERGPLVPAELVAGTGVACRLWAATSPRLHAQAERDGARV